MGVTCIRPLTPACTTNVSKRLGLKSCLHCVICAHEVWTGFTCLYHCNQVHMKAFQESTSAKASQSPWPEEKLFFLFPLAMGPTRHVAFICSFTHVWCLCYLQLALLGLFQDMTEPV